MAYVSLYRKYRPQTFTEVVGQRHVTQTLANAIAEDRLHHAYLFTGPRGTGKTSTARILAKAVNCERGPTPEPCGACDLCVSIADGSSVDVVELDMASHGGVDDARDLRERALFSPARARRKVYILDEVHMASSAAFNALLKLIEEPPGHVLFAMATTDPQKVLPTIMSRVQRLDLRRVGAADVAEHVHRLCSLEEVQIEDAAVDAVVRAGEGSVRDTLSILEQVLAFAGRKVTGDDVAQLLGHTPAERIFTAVDLIADGDLAGSLGLVGDLLDAGIDLRRFTTDLVAHVRDLLVLQVAPDRPDLVDAHPEHVTRLQAQAPRLPRETLLTAVDLLSGTVVEMRRGPARLPLELAFAKLTLGTGTAAPALAAPASPPASASGTAPGAPAAAPADSAPTATGPSARDAARAALAAATGTRGETESGERTEASAPVEPSPAEQSAGPEPSAPPQATASGEEPEPDGTGDGSGAVAVRDGDRSAPSREVTGSGAPARSAGGEAPLDEIRSSWQQVLDVVKQESPRIHAIYTPATPVAVEGRVLVLAYPQQFAGFHGEEAVKAENAEVLTRVIARLVGPELTVSTRIVEDEADGPAAAETQTPAVREDEAAVTEAESDTTPVDLEEALDRAEALLRDELGARPVDDPGAR